MFISAFFEGFFFVRGQGKIGRREEVSFSQFEHEQGGEGQRMLDKEAREEGRVKRRTNEKHPSRKALSHRPQLSVSTASLPL